MKTQKSHIQYVKKGKYCICNGNIILLWALLLLFSVVFQFVLLLFQKSIKKHTKVHKMLLGIFSHLAKINLEYLVSLKQKRDTLNSKTLYQMYNIYLKLMLIYIYIYI